MFHSLAITGKKDCFLEKQNVKSHCIRIRHVSCSVSNPFLRIKEGKMKKHKHDMYRSAAHNCFLLIYFYVFNI